MGIMWYVEESIIWDAIVIALHGFLDLCDCLTLTLIYCNRRGQIFFCLNTMRCLFETEMYFLFLVLISNEVCYLRYCWWRSLLAALFIIFVPELRARWSREIGSRWLTGHYWRLSAFLGSCGIIDTHPVHYRVLWNSGLSCVYFVV